MRRSVDRSVITGLPRTLLFAVAATLFVAALPARAGDVSGTDVSGTDVPGTVAAANDASDSTAKLESLFNDFIHFARLGKFTEADAYAKELLGHPALSPLKLLAIADKDKNGIPTLITLIQHSSLRDRAEDILDLIHEGEFERRKQSDRIRLNIDKLGGHPQMEYNAIARLKESGEYSVRWLVDALLDDDKSSIWPRIIRTLPQIGKPAVVPLSVALAVDDVEVRRNLMRALGEIGYPQAVPYLLKWVAAGDPASGAAIEAIERIQRRSKGTLSASPVDAFVALARMYYREKGSVKADPRLRTANVWYWEDEYLRSVAVPTEIYGPVMAMRCCEEVLKIAPDHQEAIALWLAANIRREARLGMDVESTESDPAAEKDNTRAADFPRSIYFSRAAGPEYCHRVLGRALSDRDKRVALGAIAALDVVAGESSLVGSEDHKQPLVRALQFPDAEVRIKAAIALARALPKSRFAGSELVAPVLAEALGQLGQSQFVLVDGDAENLNRTAGELRDIGAKVVAETNFFAAMERARTELPNVNGFFIATDIASPAVSGAVAHLRSRFRFARVPIVVLVKPQEEYRAEQVLAADHVSGRADALANGEELLDAIDAVAEQSGGGPLATELALELALRTADVLRLTAQDSRSVIELSPAVDALITALGDQEQELRIKAAEVLALVPSSKAQRAIAELALDASNDEAVRLVGFDMLAESAKRHGNQLTADQVERVVQAALAEADLGMRTAASQALGALNLKVNEASEIIRSYHRG